MFLKTDWQPFLTPYLAALFVVFFFAKMLSPFLNLLDVASTLCIIFSIVTFVFALIYGLLKKNLVKASVLSTVLILFFSFKNILISAAKSAFLSLFNFKAEQIQISSTYLYLIYLLAFLGFSGILYFLFSKISKILTPKFTHFLNTTLLVLSLFELYNINFYAVQYQTTYSPTVSQYLDTKADISKLSLSVKDSLPDVYWFILDEHIGFDKGKESLNFDNQDLLNFFVTRKFAVASNAQSGYRETEKCIASILNVRTLPPMFKDVTKGWINKSITSLYLKKMINESFWGQLVYKHWDIKNLAFFELANSEKLYRFEDIISTYGLKEHLFLEFFNIHSLKKVNHHNALVLDEIPIKNTAPSKGKASFHYIHLLMPHIPYFYDETGKFYPNGNTVNTEGYVGYVKYTDKKIEKIIDDIQKHKPNAVIIVMGDHGNRNDFCKDCAFSPLFAIYLPHKDNLVLPQNFNNINTFKILLNEYFGQNLSYETVSDRLNIQ